MRLALALIVLALLTPSSALAARCDGEGPVLKEPALCSKLFEFSGQCGKTPYAWATPDIAFAVGPWEKTPIRIFDIAGDVIVYASWRAAFARMFLGNSFNADPMTPYANAVGGILDLSGRVAVPIHVEHHFRTGMQLPGRGPAPLDPHLDVHLVCEPAGAPFLGSMTVWYAPEPR